MLCSETIEKYIKYIKFTWYVSSPSFKSTGDVDRQTLRFTLRYYWYLQRVQQRFATAVQCILCSTAYYMDSCSSPPFLSGCLQVFKYVFKLSLRYLGTHACYLHSFLIARYPRSSELLISVFCLRMFHVISSLKFLTRNVHLPYPDRQVASMRRLVKGVNSIIMESL